MLPGTLPRTQEMANGENGTVNIISAAGATYRIELQVRRGNLSTADLLFTD
jgi:hypothetical protein